MDLPPVQVVPTGIDLRSFHGTLDLQKKQYMLDDLDIPDNQCVWLFVGRLAAEKNVAELIGFMSELRSEPVTLLVVGDGPCRMELEVLGQGSEFFITLPQQ